MDDRPLKILLVDCGSAKFPDLESLPALSSSRRTAARLEQVESLALDEYDALILSGGPHLFTNPDASSRLRNAFTFLDHPTPPVLGICLGFQALVLAAGGEVYRGPARRTADDIILTASHDFTAGIESGTSFAEDHCEGVRLPPGMKNLGRSAFYEVEVAADEQRQRFGVQFHPEISGAPGDRLVRNFLTLIEKS